MSFLVEKMRDEKLAKVAGSIDLSNSALFSAIQSQFPQYDPAFLWLICYQHEGAEFLQKYIEANYKQFHQVLDSKILKILSQKGKFESRLWEMIMCDILSSSGTLIQKSAAGADFLLDIKGQIIQVESIAPDEATEEELRAIRPDYSSSNFFSVGGTIHDLELPIVLRAIKGFNDKECKYRTDRPLLIAINTSKAVGLVSRDDYVLRRFLFGLGNLQLTKMSNGQYFRHFEQVQYLSKPGESSFEVGFFRNPKYQHVSGVIYTSQSSRGLVPDGSGWSNYGVTYMPNPLALHKVEINFPYFRRLECTTDRYQEIDAEHKFVSTLNV